VDSYDELTELLSPEILVPQARTGYAQPLYESRPQARGISHSASGVVPINSPRGYLTSGDWPPVTAGWDQEESAVMAREEDRLLKRGCMNINQELVMFTAGKTLEAIKSHRKQPSYREMLRSYVQTFLAPRGDPGRLQSFIDADLLEQLPPASGAASAWRAALNAPRTTDSPGET